MMTSLTIGHLFRAVPLSLARYIPKLERKRQLLCAFSILMLGTMGWAQGFYWHGVKQLPPTPAALDKILRAHELWIESNGLAGSRAELSHANLSNFNLAGVNLWGAQLDGADLAGANLTKSIFGTNGQKSQRPSSAPGEFGPAPPTGLQATFRDATGRIVSASPALGPADLSGAVLWKANLARADLSGVDLSKAILTEADLSGADLRASNLSSANFVGAKLDNSNLSNADLDGTLFEPVSMSSLVGPESATNLDKITYETNPDSLVKLRKRFNDEGLTAQERAITYALNRRQTQLDSGVERWFRIVAFDLTCRYGMTPGRPLRIIVVAWAIFSLLYIAALHRGRYFHVKVSRVYQSGVKTREFSMWPPPAAMTSKHRKFRAWFSFERRTICAMPFFSLVNAFNLGYREFNVGQWLRILTAREYEVKAVGWVRSVAGIQSLLSIYLFALWILCYFGRPFG